MAAGRRQVVLVACCGQKLAQPAPAKDLYCSQLFLKARAYAQRHDSWLILSALHGVVRPEDVIAPYDVTLGAMSRQARQAWAHRVREQLAREPHYIVLAGQKYCGWIDDSFSVERPLQGLGIGQQLSWLKKELDASNG